MSRTLREIENDVLEELKERLEGNVELHYGGEIVVSIDEYDLYHEIADSNVPIYNYDLMRLGADNLFLAVDEPELGPAFDGSPTPVNIIAANIYEHLQDHMLEHVETIKEQLIEEMEENRTRCYECDEIIEEKDIIGDEKEVNGEIVLICMECYEDE